jgi:hypothetical protein
LLSCVKIRAVGVSPAYDTVTYESNIEMVFEDWVKSVPMHKRQHNSPVCSELMDDIDKLLSWGIEGGGGEHRIYVVGVLVGLFVGKYENTAGMQDCMYGFLEGRREDSLILVCRMFSELGQAGVFSYQLFLQRLIARGSLEEKHQPDKELLAWYRMLLKELPVYNAEACHMNLRRSVLYGYEVDNEDARDNAMLAKIKEDLKVVVPRLFKQRKIVSLADVPFRSQEDIKRLDTGSGMKHYCEVKLCEWVKKEMFGNILTEEE